MTQDSSKNRKPALRRSRLRAALPVDLSGTLLPPFQAGTGVAAAHLAGKTHAGLGAARRFGLSMVQPSMP
jgi:hypothetical protein